MDVPTTDPVPLPETPDLQGAYPRLGDEQVQILSTHGERRATRPGQVLYRKGDERYDFYVVLAGTVAAVEDEDDGVERVVAVHGPGRFLGELSLLTDQAALLTAVVQEAGQVLAVPVGRLRELVSQDPALGDLVLRAYLIRRSILIELGVGLRIIGSRFSPDTKRLLQFAARNLLPHRWIDLERDREAEALLSQLGVRSEETPVVIWQQQVLRNPSNAELARTIGLLDPGSGPISCDLVVVGAGPAGLEAARVAGMRGYDVALAEESDELGGRVARERRLPGLAAWGRVADYRTYQLSQLGNVETYRASRLKAEDILNFGFEHVAIATGSRWRRDGVARFTLRGIEIAEEAPVYTPDDLMEGAVPRGRIIVYDDDHYYMGGVMAELLARTGSRVMIVTPSSMVSDFSQLTLEQRFIQRRLLEMGVQLKLTRGLGAIAVDHVKLACIYTGKPEIVEMEGVVLVTARVPKEELALELKARQSEWQDHGLRSVTAIGDCLAPATIAHAVYSGHRFGRLLDRAPDTDAVSFKREVTQLSREFPAAFP